MVYRPAFSRPPRRSLAYRRRVLARPRQSWKGRLHTLMQSRRSPVAGIGAEAEMSAWLARRPPVGRYRYSKTWRTRGEFQYRPMQLDGYWGYELRKPRAL